MANNITLGTYNWNLSVDSSRYNLGMRNAQNSMNVFDNSMGKFSNFIKTSATVAITGLGATIAGTTVKATKDFGDFQKQMNEVFTLLPGISKKGMDSMSGDVKKFSKEFGVLPEKTVPALYQAISAGVPKSNVFSFLETAQKAAKGGVTELETAVDGISSVVNAYGQDVISATKASDLMFTAVKLGKTDFTQLSQSLFNVIPTASALGVKFEDVTAGLAAITAQGTPTSVATTQMRQLFVELSKEGGKTSKIFQEIAGKSFKQFVAEGGNTQDALKLLETYSKKTGVGINDLFSSVEAGNSALALTGKGTEKFSSAIYEMGNATGATEKAYAQMQVGIIASLDKIKASAKVMLLDLGEKLAPQIQNFADSIQANMPQIQEKISSAFTIAGNVASAFGNTIKFLVDNSNILIPVLSGVVTGITAFSIISSINGLMVAWRTSTIAQTLAQGGLNAVLMANPFGAVALAIGGLVTAGVLLYKNWDVVKSKASELGNAISEKWNGIKDTISKAITRTRETVTNISDAIANYMIDKFDWLLNGVFDIMDGMKKVFSGDLTGIKQIFSGNMNIISGVTLTTINGIKSLWSSGFNALDTITGGKLSSILTKVQDITGKVKEFFSNMFDFKIPKIKLPHFDLKGSFSLNPPSVPTLGVNWYDKGGIFSSPSVIGVGEKRPEFVGALDDLRYLIRDELNKNNNSANSQNVVINASFPNANNATEIERAFMSLSSKSKQYATGGRW